MVRKILVLGLAYKPNVDDERQSPSYVLMELLQQRGAEVEYHDPYVPVIGRTREHGHFAGKKSIEWNRSAIQSFDLVPDRNQSFVSELSGTWRVGGMHRGHPKRNGRSARCVRQSLESIAASLARTFGYRLLSKQN